MKQITKVRKAVCVMANELKKLGYSLSQAFKKAWAQVKNTIKVSRSWYYFLKIDRKRLQLLKQFHQNDLTVTLEREPDNEFNNNAIQIIVHIKPISRRTVIGYLPKELARELSKVIDIGIQVKASLIQIIGGYSYKEMLGALIDIRI